MLITKRNGVEGGRGNNGVKIKPTLREMVLKKRLESGNSTGKEISKVRLESRKIWKQTPFQLTFGKRGGWTERGVGKDDGKPSETVDRT